jgi:hypothetical protein
MQTINLQWKQYAQVKDRIAEAHIRNKELSITTTVDCFDKEKLSFLFKATVENERWSYTGHALQSIKAKKDFEKWETIAVGRALALAGYLADWEIASYEEIEDFISQNK